MLSLPTKGSPIAAVTPAGGRERVRPAGRDRRYRPTNSRVCVLEGGETMSSTVMRSLSVMACPRSVSAVIMSAPHTAANSLTRRSSSWTPIRSATAVSRALARNSTAACLSVADDTVIRSRSAADDPRTIRSGRRLGAAAPRRKRAAQCFEMAEFRWLARESAAAMSSTSSINASAMASLVAK